MQGPIVEQALPQRALLQHQHRLVLTRGTHILGVVGYRGKIQRPVNPNRVSNAVFDSATAGKHIGIIRRRPGALTLSTQKLHHLRRNHIPQRFQHIQGANHNVEILQFTAFVERDQVYAL